MLKSTMYCSTTLQLSNKILGRHFYWFSADTIVRSQQVVNRISALKTIIASLLICGLAQQARASNPPEFLFGDRNNCEQTLLKPDNYTLSLNSFNVSIRFKNAVQGDYVTNASKECLDFTDIEKAKIEKELLLLKKALGKFILPLPSEVLIVRTTGVEEFGHPYTRGNTIILTDDVFRQASQPGVLKLILSHELFHIALRTSLEFRSKVFGQQGYRIEPRNSLNENEILNPDSDDRAVISVTLLKDGSTLEVTPIFLSSKKEVLLEWPLINGTEKIQPEKTNINDLLVKNTTFINPDELLAESFALIIQTYGAESDNLKIADPQRLDQLLSFLLGKKTTFYSDKDLRWQNQGKFNPLSVLSTIKKIYDSEINQIYKSPIHFVIHPDEKSQIAQATNCPQITFGTGFINNRFMSATSFAMVVCHELGHCLSGPPFKTNMSFRNYKGELIERHSGPVELQADYWSTAKCMKRYLKETDVPPEALSPVVGEEACKKAHLKVYDQEICIRIARASVSLMSVLENQGTPSPRLNTPNQRVVQKTERYYTDTQCRLDTLFQGALCSVNPMIKNSLQDEYTGYCNQKDGISIGIRPACWYLPGGPVQDTMQSEYKNN